MSKIETGGAAFPTGDNPDSRLRADPGMTLRDYFAAQALPGLICRSWQDASGNVPADVMSRWGKAAYLVADAMMEARK